METDVVGSQFAPETSANSAMSWNEFYDQELRRSGHDGFRVFGSPDHWLTSVANWFTGDRDRIANMYDRYLTENQRAYEQQNISNARKWEEYLDSTKYQRMTKDLEAAGLNPWLALQNGVGSSSVQPGSTSYNTSAKKFESKKSNASNVLSSIINTAIRVAAIVALKG